MAKFRIQIYSSHLEQELPHLEEALRADAAAKIARQIAPQLKHVKTPQYFEPGNPKSGIQQWKHTFEIDIV